VLGARKFNRLIDAYLIKEPSRSYTLRDLPQRLESFIRRHPELTAPHTALAADMATFEWAQIECLDGAAYPPLTPDDLADRPPARLRLGLQPQIKLLTLRYPVDDYALALKPTALRGDASNAVASAPRAVKKAAAVRRPRAERIHLAVHRHEGSIYYKRLEPAAWRVLLALRAGKTLPQSVVAAGRRAKPEQVQAWFANWMQLGWFCARK
jgi:hypothetical protein